MDKQDIARLAETLHTSEEIMQAIVEITGDSEDAIFKEWHNPKDNKAIIARAIELAEEDEFLYWGSEGLVN